MKITVTESMFKDQFKACGREDNFSYAGLSALFDHCEAMESDLGDEWELDVIALCCEFSEESYVDVAQNYNIDLDNCEDEEERFDAVVEYMEDNTAVVFSDFGTGMILYQNF